VCYRIGVRFGFFDLFAGVAFLLALVLPTPSREARPLYMREGRALESQIAEAQVAVARDAKDGAAAARLADLLVAAHQTDWAIRIAAAAAEKKTPTSWRAAVAVSAAYMDRREIAPAYEWAAKAQALCEGGDCPDDERVRVDMYATALRAVRDSGIDVKKTSKGVDEAALRAVPLIRLGGKKTH
jgi:hypothetical protein